MSYKSWYLMLACVVYSLSYFYRNGITPIADVLQDELNTTSTGVGMLSSFLYGSYFSVQIVVGLLLEVFSFQILILFASFFLGVSLIAFSFSPNVIVGIIIRFISGFIVAPPFVTGMAMASQLVGNEYVSMYSGLMFFCGNTFVFCTGYLQAYMVQEHNNWRSVYIIIGFISIIVSVIFFMVTIYQYVYYQRRLNQTTALLTAEVEASKTKTVELTKEKSKVNDMNDLKEIEYSDNYFQQNNDQSFFNFLVYRANRNNTNMKSKLTKSLKLTVKNKYNYYLGLHAFCFFVIAYAMNGLWIINYLMVKFNYSREGSSIISGIFFMGMAFGSLFSGKIAQYYRKRIPLLTVSVILTLCATISLIYFTNENTSIYVIYFLSIINGIGSGSNQPIHYILVREYNNYYDCEDTATGFVNVMRTSSGFIAQFLMGVMIDINWNARNGNYDDNGNRVYTAADYNFAFLLCTIAVCVSVVLLFILPETNSENLIFEKTDIVSTKSGRDDTVNDE
eukprot:437679_1